MIKHLHIRDYALIESIAADFAGGLNIITGETGAGKSIIIDALGLLLGSRAQADVIRKGAAKAIVEGIFEVSKNRFVKAFCEANNLDFSDELILRREISAKGSSRAFINDTPVPLSAMKEAGDLLVDVHGQHEHQALLKTQSHIRYLDDFAALEDEAAKFQEACSLLNAKNSEYRALLAKEQEVRSKKDFYSFQLSEISSVDPLENEDETIAQELRILENAEKIIELAQNAYAFLYDGDGNSYGTLNHALHELAALSKFDASFEQMHNDIHGAAVAVKEAASTLQDFINNIDLDPARLEHLRARLLSLNMLKKKYGGSLGAVIAKKKEIEDALSLGESFDEALAELRAAIIRQREICGTLAASLSGKRQKMTKPVITGVLAALNELGIPNARFEIRVRQVPAHPDDDASALVNGTAYKIFSRGIDEVEFYISTNQGEDCKPLAKVASGGEISRVMLSLKSILAKNDRLPLLIFDEIDTGVSGRIAQKVGQKLRELARCHQILAITHLPQIAAMADEHYSVEKKEDADRTSTRLRRLPADEHVAAVAKLISGEKISETSIKTARELIAAAQ